MKRTLFFILLFLPMLPLAVKAQVEVFDDILYFLDDYTLTARVEGSDNREISGNVDIPETITYDGHDYSVTSIAPYAFRECTKLTGINIPNSVTTIGGDAFYNCTGLTAITIPISVTKIGGDAFSRCTSLTTIEVAEGNPVFDSRENCNAIIKTNSNTLVLGCQNSTVPNSVTTIGHYAFGWCTGLTSITIPNSVTNIEYTAFLGCSSLSSVIIGDHVESIGNRAFEKCSSLTSVIIPNSVATIGEEAFRDCSNLSSVIIGDGVKSIERLTFLLCTNLSSVTIGNSVESIKYGAFMTCTNLTSVNIPNSVTTIASETFEECSSLSSVTIGNSVTSIGEQAFRLCSKLEDFYSYAEQVPNCHWSSFSGSNCNHATLHVPAASVSAYQAVGPWNNFKEIVALPAQGGESDYFDYLPFVKEGKRWNVFRSDFDTGCYLEQYMLGNEGIVKEGKTYTKMTRSEDDLDVIYDTGLFREEDRKVYIFDAESQEEHLMFDYSLKEGDTYETFSYDEQRMVTYKVLSVSDYQEGPEVIRYDYNQEGSLIKHHRYLKKWTVCRTDNESLQKTWIEGVGSLEGPLGNLHDVVLPGMTKDYLGYVEYLDYDFIYLPFSFCDTLNRQVYGCDLPMGEADHSWVFQHQLNYELEGDRLHIYGKAYTQCNSNYAYFFEKPTDDPLVHKIEFEIEEMEPMVNCMALHATDFYVSGFDPNLNYIVVDNQGVEHPVINKNIQMAYRPFIEEGKVWKLGGSEFGSGASGNPVWRVEYYYFDGDTIINGKTCKQMMRQRYISPNHPDYDNYSLLPSLSYVGAWYEEDMKVYFYNATSKQFSLWYDFSLNAYDTLQIEQAYGPYVLGPRQTGGIKGFKGVYRDVMMCPEGESMYNTTWLEGIGSIDGPIYSVYYGSEAHLMFLMSCVVGDEVIYLNDEYEDGATPEVLNARKQQIDFTHTIKTRPKAPKRGEAQQSLYGEYNALQLDINLTPLDDAYLVRITDETDKAVYEKTVNAGNIVGLNIDISTYAEGRYTVTVENSEESFTGVFETQTTGISDAARLNDKGEMINDKLIYNLQGQRLSSLQKGLNIVNKQKVYVK